EDGIRDRNVTAVQTCALPIFKKRLNMPQDKKVILYAPTWRDNDYYSTGKYRFNLQLDIDKLKDKLSGEFIILLRMHYLVAEHFRSEERRVGNEWRHQWGRDCC